MSFLYPIFFSTRELVLIQLGLFDEVYCEDYSEYCSDILIKKGFIAEMRGIFDEAVKYYSDVSSSKTVQGREFKCRKTIKRNTEKTNEIYYLSQIQDNDT